MAALQVLAVLVEKKEKASKILNVFDAYPQILRNVKYKKSQNDILKDKKVISAIKKGKKSLGKDGRVIIRKSGTEPLIRVMTECKNKNLTESVANSIVEALQNAG